MSAIAEKIQDMPADIQREVLDFAEFLMKRHSSGATSGIVLRSWVGTLREFKDKFSSIDLQRQASEWRMDSHVSR